MSAEPIDPHIHPYENADYATLAREVRDLKAAVATIAEQVAHQGAAPPSTTEAETVGLDDEERAILAYLTDAVSPAERAAARIALDALVTLASDMTAGNGLTADELADRFDQARRAVSLPG